MPSYEQPRGLDDRSRARQLGVKVGDNVDVVYHPKSGDPAIDNLMVDSYFKEHFDVADGGVTSEGTFMQRPKEAAAIRDKYWQDRSQQGLVGSENPDLGAGPHHQTDEDRAESGIRPGDMVSSDPNNLEAIGVLTVPSAKDI